MLLEKWYSDCILEGEAQLRYRANLTLGPVTVGYAGTVNSAGFLHSEFRLRPVRLPEIVNGCAVWPLQEDRQLTWSGAQALPHTLFTGSCGELTWSPCVLSGQVHDGETLQGRGYLECLRMNFAPWRLGLRTLRWGRYCGEAHSLVWIEWIGANALRLLLVDGNAEGFAAIDPLGVRSARGHDLRFDTPTRFIHGPLGGNVAGALPWALRRLRFFRGVEQRWLAQAELALPSGARERGNVVFEEVSWP